ncbi:tetratricopeptide repeat protein [Chitinophaga costaii]|nr:tetratricopeptide repeat protein [Chitinophaga costaii]
MRFSLWKRLMAGGLLLLTHAVMAQSQDASELFNTAHSFLVGGDYNNAILVLNQALQQEPDNLQFKKELGFAYYLKGDMSKARSIIDPLMDKKDADVQLFQIAGNIAQSRDDVKSAQKIYDRGLRRFPSSGELHNENGQLQLKLLMNDAAIKSWITGIRVDPNYPGNYYNAARAYYYIGKEPVWAIIYGEIFLNLESYTDRTVEIRELLLESYKKLFSDARLFEAVNDDNSGKKSKRSRSGEEDFLTAYKKILSKQAMVVTTGIDPESLIMLRTRFLLDWYAFYSVKFPYALFDYQQQLLKEGLFEAYNQWIFGPPSNQAAFRSWANLHKPSYDAYIQFQRDHPLKLRPDEYYGK